MLANAKKKCVYCQKTSYFYVFTWEKEKEAAIWTECPVCKKHIDVWHFPREKLEVYLALVLQGKEPSGT